MDPQPHHTNSSTTPKSYALCCVRGLTWTFISLFLILSIIIPTAWLVLNPHEPGFRVSSVSVSNFSVSESQLKGRYQMVLDITNPNKKIQVMADSFKVWVGYGSLKLLGVAVVQQPIYLDKMSNLAMKVELTWGNSPTSTTKLVPEDLVKDWNKGVLNFNVKMEARVRYQDGIWPTKEKYLDVYCNDLDVGFFGIKDTGKLLDIGKECCVRS